MEQSKRAYFIFCVDSSTWIPEKSKIKELKNDPKRNIREEYSCIYKKKFINNITYLFKIFSFDLPSNYSKEQIDKSYDLDKITKLKSYKLRYRISKGKNYPISFTLLSLPDKNDFAFSISLSDREHVNNPITKIASKLSKDVYEEQVVHPSLINFPLDVCFVIYQALLTYNTNAIPGILENYNNNSDFSLFYFWNHNRPAYMPTLFQNENNLNSMVMVNKVIYSRFIVDLLTDYFINCLQNGNKDQIFTAFCYIYRYSFATGDLNFFIEAFYYLKNSNYSDFVIYGKDSKKFKLFYNIFFSAAQIKNGISYLYRYFQNINEYSHQQFIMDFRKFVMTNFIRNLIINDVRGSHCFRDNPDYLELYNNERRKHLSKIDASLTDYANLYLLDFNKGINDQEVLDFIMRAKNLEINSKNDIYQQKINNNELKLNEFKEARKIIQENIKNEEEFKQNFTNYLSKAEAALQNSENTLDSAKERYRNKKGVNYVG